MSEQWRTVAAFPDYAVSSIGRVKRIVPDKQGKYNGRILKTFVPNNGYITVMLYRDSKPSHCSVHRLVCIAFKGNPPTNSHHATHRDGNRTNNLRGNIRWRTPSENNMERHRHGTMLTGDNHPTRYMPSCVPRGSRHGNAIFHEKDIVKIRKDKRTSTAIAKEYKAHLSTICKIRNRKVWKHVA